MSHSLSYDTLLKAYNSQVEKYNTLIETSPDGIMLLQTIRNEAGIIVDFLIAHCNRAGTILGHFPPGAVSKTLLTILPHLKDSEQFNMHRQVVETGEPIQFETTFRDEQGKEYGWFIVSLLKLEDAVFSRFIDITEKKETEQRIKSQASFYNGILETSINGIMVCKAMRNETGQIDDFTIIKVNKAFSEVTTKSIDEAEGALLLSVFPEARKSDIFSMYCEVANSGIAVRKEVQNSLGQWYDVAISRIDENTIALSFANITQRIKAFEEVQQQRNLLDNILQHSSGGITVGEMVRDDLGNITDVRIILANDMSAELTSVPKSILLENTIATNDPNFLKSDVFKMAVNTVVTGQSFRTQYYFEAKQKWIELGVSKMDDDHLVNILTDITDTKESQLRLEKLVDELRRTNANLEEFTYAASHDLKEPIRKIRIFADKLKANHTEYMDEEGRVILERLLSATMRMRTLVDDLLEYSHVSLMETETESVDLSEKIDRVLTDLELLIAEKKAIITWGEMPVITGHKRQLQQLFQNLIGNSLKYSRAGIAPLIHITSSVVSGHTISAEITVEEKDKNFYNIQVSDNGIGFEQAEADKIFRVFQRLHGREEYQGTGIGLTIVKKVVENHCGHITAIGTPGHGAVFNVYLPVV